MSDDDEKSGKKTEQEKADAAAEAASLAYKKLSSGGNEISPSDVLKEQDQKK